MTIDVFKGDYGWLITMRILSSIFFFFLPPPEMKLSGRYTRVNQLCLHKIAGRHRRRITKKCSLGYPWRTACYWLHVQLVHTKRSITDQSLVIAHAVYEKVENLVNRRTFTQIAGILSQETEDIFLPVAPNDTISYIAASYVQYIEGAGARVVPVR